MSLINDALRRASQSDRDRPQRVSTPIGLKPVPASRSSRLPMFVAATVLVALMLACWFFGKWWMARNDLGSTPAEATMAAPATVRAVPPSIAVETVPVTPVAPITPAAAPIAVSAPGVVASPVTPAVEPPNAAWPVELKLSGLFINKTNAQVVINGNLYRVGDNIQGVVLKKIEKNKVTVEWNGQSKILRMEEP
jgi:hypothetical protein